MEIIINGSLSWSNDSEELFFSAYRSGDWELVSNEADIYSVSVSTNELKQIIKQSGEKNMDHVTTW